MNSKIVKILELQSINNKGNVTLSATVEKKGDSFYVSKQNPQNNPPKEADHLTPTHGADQTVYGSEKEALSSPLLNQEWENLHIRTNLKLHEIKDNVLNIWGTWNKSHQTAENPNQKNYNNAIVYINDKSYHKLSNPINCPNKEHPGVKPDDNLQDPTCSLIKELFISEKNSKQYQTLKKVLTESVKKKGYISYNGDSRDFGGLNCTGMSIIYEVPHDKRGNLSKFKGQTIRICCVGSGVHALREYLAGPVDKEFQVLPKGNLNNKELSKSLDNPTGNPTGKPTHVPKHPGFLSHISLIPELPVSLQLILENRDLQSLINFSLENKLSTEAIEALNRSNYPLKIASEGNINMLKHLKSLGASMANPKETPPPGSPLNSSTHWHSLLWAVQENHPSKTRDLIKLYSKGEFQALAKDEFINTSLPNIKSIILTERQRRVKNNIESLSQSETLNIE